MAFVLRWAAVFLVALPACSRPAPASADQLASRAAFDLRCAPGEMRAWSIDARTRGVMGCGQRAVYIETCSDGSRCTWSLDALFRDSAPALAAEQSPAPPVPSYSTPQPATPPGSAAYPPPPPDDVGY